MRLLRFENYLQFMIYLQNIFDLGFISNSSVFSIQEISECIHEVSRYIHEIWRYIQELSVKYPLNICDISGYL